MTTFVWCRGRAARGTRRRQDLQEMLQTPGGTYSKALRAARPALKDDLSWKETRQTLISPPSRHREWIKPAPCQQRAFWRCEGLFQSHPAQQSVGREQLLGSPRALAERGAAGIARHLTLESRCSASHRCQGTSVQNETLLSL